MRNRRGRVLLFLSRPLPVGRGRASSWLPRSSGRSPTLWRPVPPGPRGEAPLEAPPSPPGMLWVRDPARPAPPLAPRPGPDPACKPSRVKSSFVVSGVCSSSDEFAAERRKDAQHRSTLQQGPGRRRSCGEEMLDRVLSALTLSLHSRGAEGTR